MTARVSRRGRAVGALLPALAAACAAALPSRARAQAVDESGAQSVLLPLGPRVVGLGGAGVAAQLGIESQLVNPAALGFATAREISLLHGQDVIASRDLLGVALPFGRVGTAALTGYLVNLAQQDALDEAGNRTGTLYIRTVAAAATFATTFRRDLAVGLTYRLLQFRIDCSGSCGETDQENVASTSMVDAGVQYDFRRRMPLVVGASLRYLGLRLQVRDSDQADALPTQLAVGARYDVAAVARRSKEARVRVLADVVQSVSAGGAGPSVHVGAEGTFRDRFTLRGGWVQRSADGGPSVGFGYANRRLGFDVARTLTGLSVESGEPPTFVSLRYFF